ncbi:hypothetical protein JZ751_007441 [Albula glossodonta]|uniref:UPAR/Ly6 domain-containing protein n=1 Tax=Albula glossodonta TaxID=121402 RepID=A0A8T2N9Z3_9TELE|nr:hypothetical protein JZ751_007441 [Albula glossodonta]
MTKLLVALGLVWLLPGSALVTDQEPPLRGKYSSSILQKMMKLLVALGLCCTAPEPCNPQTCPESQDMCASLAVGFSTATPLADNSPNGRQCFTCEGDLCNKTLDCQGPEDRCFSLSVNNQTQMQKGCVSKSICDNAQNPALESLSIPLNITCCKGNLCNSAPRVGQSSFLLLFFLMPLPSIAFFR